MPPPSADAGRPPEPVGGAELVSQGDHRRQQGDRRAVVRVAPRIGFGREVLHERDGPRQFRLTAVDEPALEQLGDQARRGRAQELPGDLDPRHLADDRVGADDAPVRRAPKPLDPVVGQRERRFNEGRCADQPHPAPQEHVHQRHLQLGVARAVDQVDPEGHAGPELLEPVDGLLDLSRHEAARAEKPQHAGRAGLRDHLDRGDRVGHLADDVGVLQPALGLERGVSQRARGQRRDVGAQREAAVGVRGPPADFSRTGRCDGESPVPLHDVHRAPEVQQRGGERLRQRLGGAIARPPPAQRRIGVFGLHAQVINVGSTATRRGRPGR